VEVPGLGGGGRSGDAVMICPQEMDFGKERRPFFWHKGHAGRVAVHAGSGTYAGAAVLAAIGALRGGAGWVTLHVPEEGHARAAALCPPEIIVRAVPEATAALDEACDARVLGCGWGELDARQQARLIDSLRGSDVPTVIDADALNALSWHPLAGIFLENHLLTPHPGEFRRLAPDLAELPAEEAAREFVLRHPATLLLKGARTCIARRGEPLRCNPTGGPGMACGGQGDFLAGLLAALLACPRGRSLAESAALGAWLAGRAAEIACLREGHSEESLSPSDSARWLGQAWEDWRRARR
jgi:ADP-dependent NAD(P)H-hydrate dehydratase / NAD(P)H-hydrate epimerase